MNKAEREARDRMVYSHYIDFTIDGLTKEQAEREIVRQTGLSLKAVRAAIRRRVLTREI